MLEQFMIQDEHNGALGYATYYSAIKYDNLTSNQLKVASAIELKATAYVDIAVDGLRLYKNAHVSFKAWGYFNAVVLENCAGVYEGNSSAMGTISTNSLYMISETETPVAADRYATNTKKTDVNKYEYLSDAGNSNGFYGGIYWYASYELIKT